MTSVVKYSYYFHNEKTVTEDMICEPYIFNWTIKQKHVESLQYFDS